MTKRDEIYMATASLFSGLSTCERGQVGCVIVQDRRIIATGYNGAPADHAHCTDVGCDLSLGEEAGCQRIVHAELNAILYAGKAGVSVNGSSLYSTHAPCGKCAQAIITAGIQQVKYHIPYRLPRGLDLLFEAGMRVERL